MRAFALIEIAVALGLLALCVTGVVLAFPVGIRAQQVARFRLIASAKAEEMVDAFSTLHNHHTVIDAEAPQPWEVAVSRRAMAHDIEARLGNPQTGMLPLPLAIARRLDADGDGIQRLLDEGGRVYYAQPMATTGILEVGLDDVIANDTQRLVIGVIGYAQSNAIPIFPWKAWPYYFPYPSPPWHAEHANDASVSAAQKPYHFGRDGACWEITNDPDMAPVFDGVQADGQPCGFKPYAYDGAPDVDKAIRYVRSALWYCQAKGLPSTFWDPPAGQPPFSDFTAGGGVAPAAQVNALRFLAHAAMCLTAWYDDAALAAGVTIDPAVIAGTASPAGRVTHDRIGWWHDASLNLAMRFCASFPYDWGAPRPLQRAQQMDFPLLEYDLFPTAARPLLSGTIGDSGVPAEQWRPIAGSRITSLGRSSSFPLAPIPSQEVGAPDYQPDGPTSIWGDPENFTLAKPFAPAERCRQLVFWAADWPSYEDCETCPSAPVDAGRYNLAAPKPGWGFGGRMGILAWWDFGLHVHRNPEKNLAFTAYVGDRATGAPIDDVLINNAFAGPPDRGMGGRDVFLGRWGADRNFNKRLDRGPVPTSVRMRAREVARFNIYDARVPHVLR